MADALFPTRPGPLRARPVEATRTTRRDPLPAIRETLSVSIHDIVNERALKSIVADLYRAGRRVESEAWLRSQLAAMEEEAWIAAHL